MYIDNINIGENVGVSDPDQRNSLSVYPNPANDIVTIVLPQNFVNDAQIEIVNAIGQIIFQVNKSSSSVVTIPSENFPAGQYFVFVKSGNSISQITPLSIVH